MIKENECKAKEKLPRLMMEKIRSLTITESIKILKIQVFFFLCLHLILLCNWGYCRFISLYNSHLFANGGEPKLIIKNNLCLMLGGVSVLTRAWMCIWCSSQIRYSEQHNSLE